MATISMPDTLYHYTSLRGLDGIIKDKVLRATDIRFFSDSSEFQYTINLARELSSQRHDSFEKRFLREVLRWSVPDTTFCAFCLSEQPDLLSQWRGYCPREGGYSLGFSTAALEPQLQRNGFTLEKCEYRPAVQQERVNRLLDQAIRDSNKSDLGKCSTSKRAIKVMPRFLRALSRLAATLKHPSFSEEEEWRVVSGGQVDTECLDYEPNGSIATPHAKFCLKDAFPVCRIIVGPSYNQRLAVKGLRVLLHRNGIKGSDIVEISEIPYRPR
jgi:hypothetical protein